MEFGILVTLGDSWCFSGFLLACGRIFLPGLDVNRQRPCWLQQMQRLAMQREGAQQGTCLGWVWMMNSSSLAGHYGGWLSLAANPPISSDDLWNLQPPWVPALRTSEARRQRTSAFWLLHRGCFWGQTLEDLEARGHRRCSTGRDWPGRPRLCGAGREEGQEGRQWEGEEGDGDGGRECLIE